MMDVEDVSKRAKVNKDLARRELNLLSSVIFIKQKNFLKPARSLDRSGAGGDFKDNLRDKVKRTKKVKTKGWYLNINFPQIEIFKVLLIGSEIISQDEIGNRFKKAGRIKLLIVAGIFLQDKNSRLDLMVVGDSLKKAMVETIVKDIEAEIGKELLYAIFDTKEFSYRLNMYDKLIYDVLSYPHERIIQTAEFSTLPLKKS